MKNLEPSPPGTTCGLTPTLFVDVRMEIEYLRWAFRPASYTSPGTSIPDLHVDARRFVAQVVREASRTDRPVVLLCGSGKRTVEAGQALEAGGFREVVNVVHGLKASSTNISNGAA